MKPPIKNIALIGLMGSGKSLVGQALAQRLGRSYVSTDAVIAERVGKSINAIFAEFGEVYFRRVEHDIIRELVSCQGQVIDCGGGVVLNAENLKLLKAHGIVFHLSASPDIIYARIKHERHRPLINVPDPLGRIKEIYTQRLPLYNQADYTIDANDASIEGPIAEILEKV